MSSRHRTASAELEGRILEAALQLLGERGVEALTVRGIAARANVAPMGIYNHFDGKMGIYEALWVDGFDRLTSSMNDVELDGDAKIDMINFGRRYRAFALNNPAHYRLMFIDNVSGFVPSPEAAVASGRALQILVNRVEGSQQIGHFPKDRPIDLAQAFWATVHGFVSLELLRVNFAADTDGTFDYLLLAVYEGYQARATRETNL